MWDGPLWFLEAYFAKRQGLGDFWKYLDNKLWVLLGLNPFSRHNRAYPCISTLARKGELKRPLNVAINGLITAICNNNEAVKEIFLY